MCSMHTLIGLLNPSSLEYSSAHASVHVANGVGTLLAIVAEGGEEFLKTELDILPVLCIMSRTYMHGSVHTYISVIYIV